MRNLDNGLNLYLDNGHVPSSLTNKYYLSLSPITRQWLSVMGLPLRDGRVAQGRQGCATLREKQTEQHGHSSASCQAPPAPEKWELMGEVEDQCGDRKRHV